MPDRYDHVLVAVAPSDVPAVRRSLADLAWLVTGGAQGIGWSSDELAVVLGPAGSGQDPRPVEALPREVRDRAAVRSVERLVATARPETPARPSFTGGVLALRWFDLAAADWPEFLDLSVQAWPAFEAANSARILGLFRSLDCAEPDARALLVTWYGSLAVWERSRGTVRATEGDEAAAGRRFVRRHEITRRSVVRVCPLTTSH